MAIVFVVGIDLPLYLLKVKKLKTDQKLSKNKRVQCKRKKSMITSDNTIKAEELGKFSETLEKNIQMIKTFAKAGKKFKKCFGKLSESIGDWRKSRKCSCF